jgi:oligopeptide transport system substrate-binding protein
MRVAMFRHGSYQLRVPAICLAVAFLVASCSTSASNKQFWGVVKPPGKNVLRYVSGSEPESLDPHLTTAQPDARIQLALFDGLVEYHPKTMEPIPAIAERWENNKDNTEYTFHLRKNARWSNGDPITAKDFVYSFRRGFNPATAARSANLGYYIKYAQAFNGGDVFVKSKDKDEYVLERDIEPETPKSDALPQPTKGTKKDDAKAETHSDPDTPFHQYITSPTRLTLPGDEKDRNKAIEANPKIKAAVEGKEFVPVKAENIGVEAIDDYTFRITIIQPAPYFVGMLAHQFFRLVPQKAVEKYGDAWTQPENIVTCGAYKLEEWIPYSVIHVVRDPMYWDAANVKLDEIYFYPIEEQTTTFNMYTAGAIEGMQNHSVLPDWMSKIRPMKDWMNAPEAAVSYYQINCKKPPMNDKRVRQAFSYAIDREALVAFRKGIPKPAYGFVPPIFNGYPVLNKEKFDPELAKKLLAEAGYKDGSGKYDPSKFPSDQIELTYNTAESNRQFAEFVQAQWKQNLGINVPLKNMEFKTFLKVRAALEYKGFARAGWVGDYMDPFTFLGLFYIDGGDNGTGWTDKKYSALLDEANQTPDPQKRYELLSQAEAILVEEKPIIPLTYDATNWMKKPYVKGLYPNPLTLHAWKYVYIERDPAKWDYGVPDMTRKPGEE